jgi:hypothetical protein
MHNVPRHLCDLTFVGTNKALAVRNALRRFDPHLNITWSEENVLDIVRREPTTLMNVDYTFVAVASMPAERRLNARARELSLGTAVYVWIEPHAVAGHAIIVPPNAGSCFECLLDTRARLTIHVLDDPSTFLQQDYGCRGAFAPYGGGDAQRFARAIANECLGREYDTAEVITWIGDIDDARANGFSINPEFDDAKPYAIQSREVPRRNDCRVCSS